MWRTKYMLPIIMLMTASVLATGCGSKEGLSAVSYVGTDGFEEFLSRGGASSNAEALALIWRRHNPVPHQI